jgi:hypothetical protein
MIDFIEDRVDVNSDAICKCDFFDDVGILKFFEELHSFKILHGKAA